MSSFVEIKRQIIISQDSSKSKVVDKVKSLNKIHGITVQWEKRKQVLWELALNENQCALT